MTTIRLEKKKKKKKKNDLMPIGTDIAAKVVIVQMGFQQTAYHVDSTDISTLFQ
jgi:hypothetical protein